MPIRNRTFTCIICPNGCEIEAALDGDCIVSVTGQRCKRGEEYVRQELIDPRRTIATSVCITGAELPLCSVRLTKPVPKKKIFRIMEQLRRVQLQAPVRIGQVVLHDVCGTGSDVIVTKNLDRTEG